MGIDIDLSGRVVLVTGGTRGIGAGIAEVFLRAGAEVYVCSRREPDRGIKHADRAARFLAADVRDAEQVDKLVAEIVEQSGRLDVVVNNAGGSPVADTATASIRFHAKVIELNLTAPLLVTQSANRIMAEQDEGGTVIMISSISAQRGSPRTAAYGAAKAGLENLTATLALELAPKVRVNAVTVGLVRSENADDHYGDDLARVAATVPLGRLAEPADIGNACAFLASPLAGYITGTTLTVHGGGEPPPYLTAQT